MINFENQVALITGASGAIGTAIASLIHELGGHVIISGSNLAKLEVLGRKLKSRFTIKLCDLSDVNNVGDLLNGIENLDILVCNAGITKDGLGVRMSNEDFASVVNLNLISSFILNREALKIMMKKRYGRIVNISSVVGVSGNPGQANYCASKAGLIGMSKSLAYEVASRGITINTVAPGFIESDMTNKLNETQKAALLQKIPMKHMGEPKDVANAVIYLASKEASYVTGHTIHVNGGMLMV